MEDTEDTRSALQQKGLKSCVQELRLVLFGHGWLDKSLTGNAILQQQMFDTRRDVKMCVRRQTLNQNRTKRIIVVNTPDRWVQYSVQDPGLIQENMAECLSMCQPGPHAFLLVVPLGPNKGKEWTVEAPLTLLNDHIWKNTIVIFTKPEKLKGIFVEDYIAKIQFLGPLLERCGHRYHLLDTSFYGHESQVEDLLNKIDAMVEDNKTGTGQKISTVFSTEQIKEEVMKKAKLRQSGVETSRSVLSSLAKMREPSSEPHILLVGPKHAGKSSTGHTILCSEDFKTPLQTSQSSAGRVEVQKKKMTVVDTPGWHGRYYSHETPPDVTQQMIQSSNTAVFTAVLLVLRCDETFTETDRLKVEEHMSLLGSSVWSKAIVLFTYKDKLGNTAIEEHIERWPALQWIVNKCRNRYHDLNNLDKNDQIQVGDLLEKIEELEVLNDNQFLLQCYVQVQEKYQKLDENYKKNQIQLEKKMAENQELRKMIEKIGGKDCLANNLLKTIEQKDYTICAHENMVDEMNRTLNITVCRLENAEEDNNQLKTCLMEKERQIRLSSEKTAAQQSFEAESFHKKLTEAIKMRDQMETEMTKLQEEKKQLKTENECTKIMLQSVVTEVQKHFKKKHNLQRKMAADASTLEMLFSLEKEEEAQKSKHSEQNPPSEVEKRSRPLPGLTSSPVWLLAGGAALGAAMGTVFGGSRTVGGLLRLNLSSAAGAAAGTLLGVCLGSAGSSRQVKE